MIPKISIVIPSFNKAKFIEKTLKSIFDQTYPNLEVIVQDGGSTDGTLKILKNYSIKFPKLIKIESKHDGGQLNAVNKGMAKATGDILAFINADDKYLPDTFTSISDAYKLHPNTPWFTGCGVIIDENDTEIAKAVSLYKSILLRLNHRILLLTTNYLIQPSVFITRNAFNQFGPFTGTPDFIMEYDLWLRISSHSMPIVIYKVLSQFRIEPSTKTKRLFKPLLVEDEKIIKKYTKNWIILLFHKLNNLGRTFVGRFV